MNEPELPGPDGNWSKPVRERWFYAALALATVGVAWLFWPYMTVLLFAVVVVVVTYPVYAWVLRLCRGRRGLAAGLTTVGLAIVVFVPFGWLVYLFAHQAKGVVDGSMLLVEDGSVKHWLWDQGMFIENTVRSWSPEAVTYLQQATSSEGELVAKVQASALGLLESVGTELPALVSTVIDVGIHTLIFLFAVVTLYMEGPAVLRVIKTLSPIEDKYEDHLFEVFREFSNNMVIGSLATALIQGVMAWLGYFIVGAESAVFLGMLTAVAGFVPVVGSLVIFVPAAIWMGALYGWEWGVFVAVWNLIGSSIIDHVLRPMFMRGQSNMHPLLIFLSVFGGMAWMSVPGALVGPVIVAFFLALYTIYRQDFLGEPPAEAAPVGHGLTARIVAWLTARLFGKAKTPVAAPPAT